MEHLIIGIIAEGKSDHAVIANILKGLGININEQVQFLIPQLNADKTDLNQNRQNVLSFSNWTIVRQHCIDKKAIDSFFEENYLFTENLALIIQIDTAERFLKHYEVIEPPKNNADNYSEVLRENVIAKINEWLGKPYDNLFYAITIEETDAWVLALHEKKNIDTSAYEDPKKQYNKVINHKQKSKKERGILKIKDAFRKNTILSSKLATNKGLKTARKKNRSLDLFCTSLESCVKIEN